MELFAITRYDDENSDNQNDREKENLEKLQRKIHERKLNFELQGAKSTRVQESTEIEKLAEVEDNLELQNVIVPENNAPDEIVRKSKKRKHKKEDVEINHTHVDGNEVKITHNEQLDDNKSHKTEYKILGINDFEKKSKIKRVLPSWLCHPIPFSINLQDLNMKVSKQKWLDSKLRNLLELDGITHLFPVQETVIPHVLESHSKPPPFWPNDICVSAPTGSGKTLTFVLPIIQLLKGSVGHNIRALVVLPVQELANQVAKVFRKYSENSGLKVAAATGLVSLSQEQSQIVRYSQTAGWYCVVDILVCTAGRLVEHLHNTQGFTLKHLRFLVIDEADRIMDNIQNDWLYHLERHIKSNSSIMTGKAPILTTNSLYNSKRPPQKLLFSATLSQDPEKLDQWGLFQPRLFSSTLELKTSHASEAIRKYTTPKELSEYTVMTDVENKPLNLFALITEGKWDRVLCFTNASQSARRLAILLSYLCDGTFKVTELSSALNRSLRDAVLKKFQNGDINVLISTDALARGIDIPNCDFVISYDPPKNVKTYIHRVGRTGRAGRSGTAITMLTQNQLTTFKDILQSTGKTYLPQMDIPERKVEQFYGKYEEALRKTKAHIQTEVKTFMKKVKALKRGRKISTSKSLKQNKNK